MSTAILCLAVCVFDVMNIANMCGRSVQTSWSNLLSLQWLIFEAKRCCINSDGSFIRSVSMEAGYLHIFYVFRHACVFAWGPIWVRSLRYFLPQQNLDAGITQKLSEISLNLYVNRLWNCTRFWTQLVSWTYVSDHSYIGYINPFSVFWSWSSGLCIAC